MQSHVIGQYFLNDELNHDELRRQIALFAQAGYQGIYPHARQGLDTPYDSKAWWEAMDVIVKACQKHGMQAWIWDEDYFPSGTGGGRMTAEDPGLRSRQLAFTVKQLTVRKGEILKTDFDKGHLLGAYVVHQKKIHAVTEYCGTRRTKWSDRSRRHNAYSPLITQIGPAHWRSNCSENRPSLYWPSTFTGKVDVIAVLVVDGRPNHVDLLRPEGVKRYLDLMYEPFAKRYGDKLNNTFTGAFTDEPSPGCSIFPWSTVMPNEFKRDHHYDILEHLAHLAVDIDERTPVIRHHFRLTQGRLMRANYVEQLANWCKRHGITSTGHLTRTEWLSLTAAWWPNELRCYRAMDIPSCDPLGAAIAMPDAAAYHTGIKVASSAAHLFNKKQAGSDALAVVGSEATIADFKAIIDYHMVLGVTFFSLHGLSYSFKGGRKDEVPPSLSFQHTQFPHMHAWLEYTKNTAEKLTQGKHVCELAVLYPSTSFGAQISGNGGWPNLSDEKLFHDDVESLLSHQRDFDLIDEITLVEKTSKTGVISTPQNYKTIVLTQLRHIEQAAADVLNRLAAKGVRVVVAGPMPSAIGSKPDQLRSNWAGKHIEHHRSLNAKLIKSLPGVEILGRGARDLFVHRRKLRNQTFTFIFNRAANAFDGKIDGVDLHVPPRGSVFQQGREPLTDPLANTQTIVDLSSDWQVDFEPNQAILSLFHTTRGVPASGSPINLLERQKESDRSADRNDLIQYDARFMASGKIDDLHIVLDPDTATGDWRVLLNDQQVPTFKKQSVFDSVNLVANISPLLRTGSNPTLNRLTVETKGQGRGLHEIIHLTGSFTCDHKHGQTSMPFLTQSVNVCEMKSLQTWAALGRGSFSGAATYRRSFTLDQTQACLLDLGQVHHSAKVMLDGKVSGVAAWSPYIIDAGELKAGRHVIEIEVRTSPANRDRNSCQTTGLLGPVRLLGKS